MPGPESGALTWAPPVHSTPRTRRQFLKTTYALDAARSGHADAGKRAALLVDIDEQIEAREFTRVEAAGAIGADVAWFSQLSRAATEELIDLLTRLSALPRGPGRR